MTYSRRAVRKHVRHVVSELGKQVAADADPKPARERKPAAEHATRFPIGGYVDGVADLAASLDPGSASRPLPPTPAPKVTAPVAAAFGLPPPERTAVPEAAPATIPALEPAPVREYTPPVIAALEPVPVPEYTPPPVAAVEPAPMQEGKRTPESIPTTRPISPTATAYSAQAASAPVALAEHPATRAAIPSVPDFHSWTPERAMGPLEPLIPPASHPPAKATPAAEAVAATPPPKRRVRRLIILIGAVLALTLLAAGFLVVRANRSVAGVAPTASPSRTSQSTPTTAPVLAGTGFRIARLRLVALSAANPYTAPALPVITGTVPVLQLVVTYDPSGEDRNISVRVSRAGSATQLGESLLFRTYQLRGTGEDSIRLTPTTGGFAPGHYLIEVTHTNAPTATLEFDIVPAPSR